MIRFGHVARLLDPVPYSWFAFFANLRIPFLQTFAVGRKVSFELLISWICARRQIVCETLDDKMLVVETALAEEGLDCLRQCWGY